MSIPKPTPASALVPGDILMTSSLRTAAVVKEVDSNDVRVRLVLDVWLRPGDELETFGHVEVEEAR
ncbi:MAG: hypothetical protein M3O70_02630 [Actinomycetota bacterium]|nr:hypothetical protein [Actinomycetota bacterium]